MEIDFFIWLPDFSSHIKILHNLSDIFSCFCKEFKRQQGKDCNSLHSFPSYKYPCLSPYVTRDCAFGSSCHLAVSSVSSLALFQNCSGTFKSLRKLRRQEGSRQGCWLDKISAHYLNSCNVLNISHCSSHCFLNESSCSHCMDFYERSHFNGEYCLYIYFWV